MDRKTAVIKILGDEIELHQTIKGDEFKYWLDGSKGYLDANDCRDLAKTMIEAARLLDVPCPATEQGEVGSD